MDKSASAPSVGGYDFGDVEATRPKKRENKMKQFRGVPDKIVELKGSVEAERNAAREKQNALESRMKQSEAENATVQKELSVQLRCAGRSYQQLLLATRELTEQLRAEEDRRVTEIDALERQVRDLKTQLGQAAKPWKEEVSKRDLKILKLQEGATEQEARLRKALAAVKPIQEQAALEIKARDEKVELVLKEIPYVREQYEKELAAKDVILEDERERAKREKTELIVKIQNLEEEASKFGAPYEKVIKELNLKITNLEGHLSKVDYTPYQNQIKTQDLAYKKLVKDFRIKQQLNFENLEKMRAGFELTLKRMDKKIQEHEEDHKKRLLPWQELVTKREGEILKLNGKIEELIEEEKVARKQADEILKETQDELVAAKRAEELSRREAQKLQSEFTELEQKFEGENNPMRKVILLQMKLEEVTKQCEAQVRSKDRELKQKTDLITSLQARILEESKGRDDADKDWDHKVRQKEEGYGLVCAKLAHAEAQIVEERGRTQHALATVKRRERSIERLKSEHKEELDTREVQHLRQEDTIKQLEEEIEDGDQRRIKELSDMRAEWQEKHDFVRKRYEGQVADLRIEMTRRDRLLEKSETELKLLRKQFEKSRTDWTEKERELEMLIRSRDRQIVALKNELEFINDSWEIKYNRLMGMYEQLEQKYENCTGPNGPREAFKRAKDLKLENAEQMKMILELREMIKKQKRQIRDLQLDYDILLKETADMIAEKERGLAEMIGDQAKLESRLRKEIDYREKIVREMQAEKAAVVELFEGKVRELEVTIESLKYNDRQDLIDTIDVWKRAYERACIDRDEVEDEYKELLDTKEHQVRKMAEEYAEIKDEVQDEIAKGAAALTECEERWKKLQTRWAIEKDDVIKELDLMRQARDTALRERDRERGIADSRAVEDPELAILREKLKEKEEQLAQVEEGTKVIIGENTRLHKEIEEAVVREEAVKENWEPQIRWRDERYAAMVREHEAVKEVLMLEMLKAQEECRLIETQVKRFPSPFELELKEAEDKYSQSQASLLKLSKENLDLREKIEDLREIFDKEKAHLNEQLTMATGILVKSFDVLGLSKNDVMDLETALGVDLDGDGHVG